MNENTVVEQVEAESVESSSTPKTKEEMRFEPHEYEDNKGWCSACGRSEGFAIHAKVEEAPVELAPVEAKPVRRTRQPAPEAPTEPVAE